MLSKEYASVIPLVSNPKGWTIDQVGFSTDTSSFYSGNPDDPAQTPPHLIEPLRAAFARTQTERVDNEIAHGNRGDHNALKVALRSLAVDSEGNLQVQTRLTEYFVTWGLPSAAPQLHQQALQELAQKHTTEIPMGISTHNILVTADDHIAAIISSRDHGFSAGRVSISFETQMEPGQDSVVHNSAYRGYNKELGVLINPQNLMLLGVAAEKGSAYTSWCFFSRTHLTSEQIANKWMNARGRDEAIALLVIPIDSISSFAQNEIRPETWRQYLISGSGPDEDAVLQPHPTVPWRVGLIQQYLGL